MRVRTRREPEAGASARIPPRIPPRRLPRWLSFGAAPFAFSLALGLAMGAYAQARGSGQAAGAASQAAGPGRLTTAQLMSLAPLRPLLAPGFTLTDQHGTRVTLASFRGKAVLLGFYDPRGTQVSPLMAEAVRRAEQDLGPYAARVVFVGVNVDPAAEAVADVRRFGAEHGLAQLPNWYFLTGPTRRLEAVWKAYGISVAMPQGAGGATHSDYLYFLDPSGTERYLAEPVAGQRNGAGYLAAATIARWGRGIARYLRLAGSGRERS